MPRLDLSLFKPKTNSFHGIYRGVIEDNNDPEMLGRCKIRVWGLHTEIKDVDELEGIPTKNLPWSEPCLGLLEGSVSGNGMFTVPLKGSHVFLFFEGGNWQSPRYFATVPGKPEEAPNPELGFNDPDGLLPREDRLGEPDWHRLARGVTEETVIDWRNQNIDTDVTMANDDKWSEPESAYAAVYPNNIVISTHRGITIEIDNTEGAERLHIYHPSNSYIEIDNNGNLIFRNDGNRFEITRGTRNKHVLVDDNETIDFDKTSRVGNDEVVRIGHDRIKNVVNNDNETIGKDRDTTIGQNDTESVGKDRNTTIGQNDTESVGKDRTTTIDGNITENIGGDKITTVNGNTTESVSGNWNITTTGNVSLNASGSVDVIVDGIVTVKGTVINLN